MNPRVHLWGTWIFSLLFAVWVGASWAASSIVTLIGMLATVTSPQGQWWVLAAVMAMWVLPICVASLGLFLWLNTRFPWLALLPALIAATTSWFGWSIWSHS